MTVNELMGYLLKFKRDEKVRVMVTDSGAVVLYHIKKAYAVTDGIVPILAIDIDIDKPQSLADVMENYAVYRGG